LQKNHNVDAVTAMPALRKMKASSTRIDRLEIAAIGSGTV